MLQVHVSPVQRVTAARLLNMIRLPHLKRCCVTPVWVTQRQLRYIEWMGVKIYDFQKVQISTLFKLYNAGLGVLIPKRYHMLG